jgi:Zn-dependent protease with chaperone function
MDRPYSCLLSRGWRVLLACLCVLVLASLPAGADERTKLQPQWNLFSPQDDIKLGLQYSEEAEQQLPVLRDEKVNDYLNALGKRLARFAPGEKYPYQFKCVNVADVNAFALPGGRIYVFRGLIQAADNEAELAGVIGHEISHVALRHGTSQVSKSIAPSVGVAVLGSVLGDNAIGKLVTAAGAFSLNSLLLKYSRTDESEADILGVQIAHDAGYDPHALADFFIVLGEQEKKMGVPPEFFSNHPSPEHRIERVNEEIQKLGGRPADAKTDSAEFREIRRYLFSLPPAPRRIQVAETDPYGTASAGETPEAPSGRLQPYENESVKLEFPSNWKSNGQGSAVTLYPEGGVARNSRGNPELAYGTMVNRYEPRAGSSLESATEQLIASLRQSNPNLEIHRRAEPMRLGGQRSLSAYLLNDSPVKGKELIWLVTTMRPDGMFYVVSVAPQADYDHYSKSFEATINSFHFRQ